MAKAKATAKAKAHPWEFKARFRRHSFGWKSQPAVTRVKQAVAEIKKVAKTDPLLAAEGAVLFLERVSPALEQVDSSSGSIGTAVNRAIDALTDIIVAAPADRPTREEWLDRLREACQDDQIPYLETLGDRWGELCGTPALASAQADALLRVLRMAWSPDPELRGHFWGSVHCLSALLAAGRYVTLLAVVEQAPHPLWHYRQYGVRALAALGRVDEAVRYAHDGRTRYHSAHAVAALCEEILLASGRVEEAYRHGLVASTAGTYLATFRAVAKKYPHKDAAELLADLVRTTPGDEGKWFAAAKDAGLYDAAIALARRTPCDPKTLTRAARDHLADEPAFALEAGMLALDRLLHGYGYEVTVIDVTEAWQWTKLAAEQQGKLDETRARLAAQVASMSASAPFTSTVARLLA